MGADYRDVNKKTRADFEARLRQIRGVKDRNAAHAQRKLEVVAWATTFVAHGPESPDAQAWHDGWKALDDAAVAMLEGKALELPKTGKK